MSACEHTCPVCHARFTLTKRLKALRTNVHREIRRHFGYHRLAGAGRPRTTWSATDAVGRYE